MNALIFPLMMASALLPGSDHAASGTCELVIGLDTPELVLEGSDGFTVLEMEGFGQLMEPGAPLLPLGRFPILLPPGSRAVSVKILGMSTQEIRIQDPILPFAGVLPVHRAGVPAEELRRLSAERDETAAGIYSSDSAYPDRNAWLWAAGTLRKYSYATVAFCPVSYSPLSGRVTLVDHIELSVSYVPPGTDPLETRSGLFLMADTLADSRAQEIFVNYDAMAGLYSPPGEVPPGREDHDYLIITDDALLSAVEASDITEWKTELGLDVLTMTTGDSLITCQDGDGLEEQIRAFLREYYAQWGIQYVLLVGDYETVPMPVCYPDPSFHVYDPTNPGLVAPGTPTDCFYADLSYEVAESWDLDGDGYPGEFGEDLPDFMPEVFVGRIPVDDPGRIMYALNKSVAFEQDSGDWKNNVLHPTSILFFENQNHSGYPFLDGATMIDSLETGLMTGWDITHMSEQWGIVTSPFPWAPISENALESNWNDGEFAIVNWSGHGWPNGAARTVWGWDDGDGVPESANGELSSHYFINVETTELEDDHPSVVFAISCDVGYPEPNAWGNCGIDLVCDQDWGAAVAIVSASRPAAVSGDWKESPGGTEQICYDFNRYTVVEGASLGEALYMGKFDATTNYGWPYYYEYMNLYNFNLYGDPALIVQGYPTGMEGGGLQPGPLLSLGSARPNPAAASVSLELYSSSDAPLEAFICDLAGRRVADMTVEPVQPGSFLLQWDGICDESSPAGTGMYFVVVRSGEVSVTGKLTLVR